jgi:hypothetical protein
MNTPVITYIKHTTDKGYDSYTAMINGREESLSWYAPFLSPENRPDDTLYLLKLETRKDYGTFMQWYIDAIIGSLNTVLASQDMHEALTGIIPLIKSFTPFQSQRPEVTKAITAIAKAEGKS